MTNPIPNLEQVWLAGRFTDMQKAASGSANIGLANASIQITPSLKPSALVNATLRMIIAATPTKIPVDPVTGWAAAPVYATDDPDVDVTGWTYRVVEPGTGRTYDIVVPHDTPVLNDPSLPNLHGKRVLFLSEVAWQTQPSPGFVQLARGKGIESIEIEGGNWVAYYDDDTTQVIGPAPSGGGGASKFSELTDVSVAGAAVGKVVAVAQVDSQGNVTSWNLVPVARSVNGKSPDTAGAVTIAYADLSGMVPTSALPPLAITDVFPVANQAARLALTAQRGDIAVQADNSVTYALATDDPSVNASWIVLPAIGKVQTVNGQQGAVVLGKADVGLGNVDNTTDADKPVSTAAARRLVFLTPEQFGAVGDGVANDRPAFLAMATAAQTAGHAAIFVSKVHYLSDAVAFDVEDIEMYLAAGSHIFTTAATSQGQTLGFIGYLGQGTAVTPRRNSVKIYGPGKVTGWTDGPNENAIGIVRYSKVLVEGPHVNAGNKGVTAQIGCPDVRIRRITSDLCANNVVSVEDQAQSLRAIIEDVTFVSCGAAAVFGYGQRLEARRIRGTSAHATSGSTSQGAVHFTAGGSTLAWVEIADIDIDNANTAKGVVISTAQDGRVERVRIGASTGNAVDIFNCPNGVAVSVVDAPASPAGAVATGTTPPGRLRRSGRSREQSRALVVGEACMDRIAINSVSISSPTGVMRLSYFEAEKTETITKVHIVTGGSIPTGVTLFRMGVFTVADDDTLTLIAATPNDTALLAATNTGYDKALSAPFVKRAGARYALGILGVYSGGAIQIPGSAFAGGVGAEAAVAPRLTAAVGSLSDLPNSIAITSAHGTAAMPYLALKP